MNGIINNGEEVNYVSRLKKNLSLIFFLLEFFNDMIRDHILHEQKITYIFQLNFYIYYENFTN